MRTTGMAPIPFAAPVGGGDHHGLGMGLPDTGQRAVTAGVTLDAIDADDHRMMFRREGRRVATRSGRLSSVGDMPPGTGSPGGGGSRAR